MNNGQKLNIPKKDPWARFEAWRYHPDIMPMANVRRMLPGLGIGFGVFVVACAIEKMFFEEEDKHDNHH